MRKGQIGIRVLVLIGALAALAGCGSSSNTTSSASSAAISKAEFIAKGNAICVAGEKAQQARLLAFAKSHGLKLNQEPTKAQEAEAVNMVLVPAVQSQINAIKALGAPSGEEQQVNGALEAAQQSLDKIKSNPSVAFAKASPYAHASQLLHALGLTQCAKSG